MSRTLSITLPDELARLLREKVASGEYASESDVISAGLRHLDEAKAETEAWLRREILPAYAAYRANPSRVVPVEHVLDGIEERYGAARASRTR